MSARNDPPPAADQPAPPRSPETNQASQVDLQDTRRRQAGALPHERDQRPADQAANAGQPASAEAQAAHHDAAAGRPDTSAAPLLRQPSPEDRRNDSR